LKYVCDIVVKSSRSLSHLLMSSCLPIHMYFYPRDAMLARVLAVMVCLSVCLSVCHEQALYQIDQTLDHTKTPRDSRGTLG